MRDKVAASLYEASVNTAKNKIDQFKIDASDLLDLATRLKGESFLATVIILTSYIEEKTSDLLKIHLRTFGSKSDEEKIFGPMAPLGTFSSRIELAYSLGWIENRQRQDLHIIRKIRNLFAHEAFKVTEVSDRFLAYLKALHPDFEGRIKIIDKALIHGGKKISAPFNRRDEFTFKAVWVVWDMLVTLLTLPVAKSMQVEMRSIVGNYDKQPEAIRIITLQIVGAVFELHVGDADPTGAKAQKPD
ncbi:MAG: hypothetical protein JNL71_18375 [Rhodospirillales bacterium]|nr:hypothetical protein [Rhodospirillales bacterium]